YVVFFLDAVNARRGGKDKPSHAAVLGNLDQGREAIEVDGFAECRIQFETGVVGDTGQVNDRVTFRQALLQERAVTDISLDLLETGISTHGVQNMVSVQVEIQDFDPVVSGEEFRHEHAAHVPSAACDQNLG